MKYLLFLHVQIFVFLSYSIGSQHFEHSICIKRNLLPCTLIVHAIRMHVSLLIGWQHLPLIVLYLDRYWSFPLSIRRPYKLPVFSRQVTYRHQIYIISDFLPDWPNKANFRCEPTHLPPKHVRLSAPHSPLPVPCCILYMR